MMYGQELSMPVDVMLSLPPGEQYTAGQYAQKLQKQLQFAYEMAWVALKRTAEKQTRLYNVGRIHEGRQCSMVCLQVAHKGSHAQLPTQMERSSSHYKNA